jgi:hypothetical protein
MRPSGTSSWPSAAAVPANDDPLIPGPSSTTRNHASRHASISAESSGPSGTVRSNGCPRGRTVNERTLPPRAATPAATAADRLVPMLRMPTTTTRAGRASSAKRSAAPRYVSG